MALVYAKKYTHFPTPTVILQQGTGYRRAAAELLVAGATKKNRCTPFLYEENRCTPFLYASAETGFAINLNKKNILE